MVVPTLINVGRYVDFMSTTGYNGQVFLNLSTYVYGNIIPLKFKDPLDPFYPFDFNWVNNISAVLRNQGILQFDYFRGKIYDNNWKNELTTFQNQAIANYYSPAFLETFISVIFIRQDMELVGWYINTASIP